MTNGTWTAATRHDLIYRERGAVAEEEPRSLENLKLWRREIAVEVCAVVPLAGQREHVRGLAVGNETAPETASAPADRLHDMNGRADELAAFLAVDVKREGGNEHGPA